MANRIALVDDDQNILTSVALTLESEGFEVDCYNDGETALQRIVRRPPELGVFDIKMPRMDGIELLQKIRASSQLPVIFSPARMMSLTRLLVLAWELMITSPSHFHSGSCWPGFVLSCVGLQMRECRLKAQILSVKENC